MRLHTLSTCFITGPVIVPFFGPMTAFRPVFAVIVPLTGPMTALGGLRRSQVYAAWTVRMRLDGFLGQRGKEKGRSPQFRCRVDSWMPPKVDSPWNTWQSTASWRISLSSSLCLQLPSPKKIMQNNRVFALSCHVCHKNRNKTK